MKSIHSLLAISLLSVSCTTQTVKTDLMTWEARTPADESISGQLIGHDNDQGTKLSQVSWRKLFTELNILNIKRSSKTPAEFVERVKRSLYYHPEGFQKVFGEISKARTSDEAFMAKEWLMAMDEAKIKSLQAQSSLLSISQPEVKTFVQKLQSQSGYGTLSSDPQTSFFKTEAGAQIMNTLQDYCLVIVPGFGSHTIADYTWPEIVRQANAFYGRAETRPMPKKGDENLNTGYVKFYADNPGKGFDVLHPMGYELGFSMGHDADSATKLVEWLTNIQKIPAYSKKKFILLGYSKGTPISLNILANHPEFSKNVAAIITMAGVFQGAVPAESGVRELQKTVGARNSQELIAQVERTSQTAEMATSLLPLYAFTQFASEDLKEGPLSLMELSKKVSGASENIKAIEGIVDMSQYERTKWNIANLNNQKIKSPVTIFNFSAVTNVKDFFLPTSRVVASVFPPPPTTVPQLTEQGILETRFSRDNVFLYSTSLSGFRESPYGLFDTQVAWLDTKSMVLDPRPLNSTLSPEQVQQIVGDASRAGVALPQNFEKAPRQKLFRYLSQDFSNLNSIDLGDLRATHWDIAFEQVYKPKNINQPYYRHGFPRWALQVSTLEMLTIYKMMGGL